MNTHGLRIQNSKRHAGELFTRIPASYLKWMAQANHPEAEIAQAELDRRNIVTPEIDVSGHSIDSASNRLLGTWTSTRQGEEGLHAWLCRISLEAYRSGEPDEGGNIIHNGIRFVFAKDGKWPVLKTVMR